MPGSVSHGTKELHATCAAGQGDDRKSVEPIQLPSRKKVNILNTFWN